MARTRVAAQTVSRRQQCDAATQQCTCPEGYDFRTTDPYKSTCALVQSGRGAERVDTWDGLPVMQTGFDMRTGKQASNPASLFAWSYSEAATRMLVRVGRDDNAPRFMVPDQLTVSVRRSDFFFV